MLHDCRRFPQINTIFFSRLSSTQRGFEEQALQHPPPPPLQPNPSSEQQKSPEISLRFETHKGYTAQHILYFFTNL